jgi:hypothetical protein
MLVKGFALTNNFVSKKKELAPITNVFDTLMTESYGTIEVGKFTVNRNNGMVCSYL